MVCRGSASLPRSSRRQWSGRPHSPCAASPSRTCSDMSQRTPLAKVRGLGSAKHGTEHFWLQRVTAVANIFLVCFLIGLFVRYAGADYATVRRALAQPYIAVPLLLLVLS